MSFSKPKRQGPLAGIRDLFRGVWALVSILAGVIAFFGSTSSRRSEEAPLGERPRSDMVDEPPSPERRKFLASITVAAGATIGAVAGLPVIAFLLAPLTRDEPSSFRDVGAVGLYPVGTTTKVTISDPSALPWAGVAGQQGAYLRHNDDGSFTAFSIYCTHLGCPVHWLPDAQLFMCPCHGGVFYKDGNVASPPPQEPLGQHRVRVVNGQVEIETSAVKITGDVLKGLEE